MRCVPEHFFRLERGDVVAIRSIGGRVEKSLEGILAANWLFEFREFVVVHHTDCGALHWTTEGLRGFIRERAPGDEGIDKLDFGDIAE